MSIGVWITADIHARLEQGGRVHEDDVITLLSLIAYERQQRWEQRVELEAARRVIPAYDYLVNQMNALYTGLVRCGLELFLTGNETWSYQWRDEEEQGPFASLDLAVEHALARQLRTVVPPVRQREARHEPDIF